MKNQAAQDIENAVSKALEAGELTGDLAGNKSRAFYFRNG